MNVVSIPYPSIKRRHTLLAVLFVLFAICDSIVMHISLGMGATELNPMVNSLLRFNEMGFWYLKVLIAVGAMGFFLCLSQKYPTLMGRILTVITVLIGLDFAYDLSGLIYMWTIR